MLNCAQPAGIATASATVAASHNTTVSADRTGDNLLNAPQVSGLPEMLGAVVDDAHDSRTGRHRRIPILVHDAAQLVGGHAGDILQAQLVHGVVVAGQQVRGGAHLRHLVGAVPEAGVVARQVEVEAVHPAVAGPHLFDAGHVGQLNVLHPRAVPDQPRDAV